MATERALTLLIAVAPIVSALTIVAAIIWFSMTIQRKAAKKPPPKRAALLAIVTALLGVANSCADLSLKISGVRISTPDVAQQALGSFYRHTKNDCYQAWALLHTARRTELAKAGVDAKDFCETYATTVQYQNVHVALDRTVSPSLRVYLVNFDVQDEFATSTVHDYTYRQVKEAVEKKFLNSHAIADQFAWDLSRSYTVPYDEKTRALLAAYLTDRTLQFMLSPEAVSEAARYLKLSAVKPRGPVKASWTHFTQRITMEYEDGWKIRSGLYPPVLRATYPPGAPVPQH